MIEKPASIWRGTLADLGVRALPIAGVYVLAYMGQVVYVGRSAEVDARLYEHRTDGASGLPVDDWLQTVGLLDPANVRLDVLETPGNVDAQSWEREVEAACVKRFRPLFNDPLSAPSFIGSNRVMRGGHLCPIGSTSMGGEGGESWRLIVERPYQELPAPQGKILEQTRAFEPPRVIDAPYRGTQ